MIINRYSETPSFTTKDGSLIKELMHPDSHQNKKQSLAEARVPPGVTTALHKHPVTEELYYILSGQGDMTVGDSIQEVKTGDIICITPGSPHQIKNTGRCDLIFLCCCTPAYSDQDTVLL